MIQAMYSGISGMKAFKGDLDVIGNNIANINTTSYKSSRASFKDMLSQTVSGATAPSANLGGSNATQIGMGVALGSVDVNTTQGSMQATGRGTDLAIDGTGYFALGGNNKISYTRDGSFSLDAQFNLVSSGNGMKVLGWNADLDSGQLDTSVPITSASGIRIPVGGLSIARATAKVDIAGNLNASSPGPAQTKNVTITGNLDKTTGPEATTFAKITGYFDQNAVDGTTRDIAFTVYDQAGTSHTVNVRFTKDTGAGGWDYAFTAAGADAASVPANGTVTFDALTKVCNQISIPMNLTWNSGADAITANLDVSEMMEGASTNAQIAPKNIDGYAPNAPVTITQNIYDSLGTAHQLSITFTKQPIANTWQYSFTCPDADPASLPAPANFTFAASGVSNLINIPASIVLNNPNGAAQPLSFTVNTAGLKLADASLVASAPALLSQDGSAPGEEVPVKFDIYDSLGITHQMQLMFKKTSSPATWDYRVVCPDATDASLPPPGQITFNSLGYSQLPSIAYSLVWKNNNGSEQPLAGKINTASISQLNGATTADLSYQDGLQLGTLESFTIGRDGLVTGVFNNGSNRTLGQIALAQFNNPAGLDKMGNNSFAESPNSGTANIGVPGIGGLGMINSGFLEASNVDLATEFANMIVAQRGFQATSRVITTSDEVLQELVSLKR